MFKLTLEQKRIIDHYGSPLRVLAGPGTGKTFCLIEKIKDLVFNKRIPYNQICTITFTTVAASELRTRLEKSGFRPDTMPYVTTLHSLAMAILRKHIKIIGFKKDFRMLDKLMRKIMVKDIQQELTRKNINLNIDKIRYYLDIFFRYKSESKVPFLSIQKNKSKNKILDQIKYIYMDNLQFYNMVDWYDILIRSIELIEKYKKVQSDIFKKTKFLLVDEYQDLSPLEQRFVNIICSNHNGLVIVGDDDQSIYETFRYADPTGIIDFCKHKKNAKTLFITKCHRCPPKVINYALNVIKNNKKRVQEKTLVPFDPQKKGFAVIFEKRSKKAEILWIVEKVEKLIQKDYKPREVMILFTDGMIARDYIDALYRENIPLNIQLKVSQTFETDYFLWLLATLKWIVDKDDNLSLRKCLDYWKGIGPQTVYQIRHLAISLNVSMWNVVKNISSNQSFFKEMRQRKKVLEFCKYMKFIMDNKKCSKIVETFFSHVKNAKNDKGCNILYQYLQQYDDIEEVSLKDLLSDFEEKLETGNLENQCVKEDEGVRIMSMHSAKGCEAPIVFIPALEQDIIPGVTNNIEEKRRLFYMSLTRAKVGVFLTWAKQRTGQEIHIVSGRRMMGKKRSIFLDEILNSSLIM